MAFVSVANVRYAGLASCVPKREISNLLDCPPEQRPERERLVRNIGIEQRRICPPWQCFSDLALEAAQVLIERLQWQPQEIEALVVVTQSGDYITPATALILQDRLGLPQSAVAFDINLGCSGYPFGLHVLGAMLSAGGIKKGLLLAGDRSCSLESPIFSDAATATALEFDPQAKPMYFDLNSDGAGHRAIMLPLGGHRQPLRLEHFLAPSPLPGGQTTSPMDLVLDGTAVLSFATQQVPPCVERTLARTGLDKSQVDFFIFHQANRMINEAVRKKLDLDIAKVPSSLREFGNTSSASVPLTITACLRERLQQGPARLLLCGFGIGLSWGTCVVDIADAVFPELVQA